MHAPASFDDTMSDVHELAIRLVKTPSHPGIARREAEVVGELARYLDAHGVEYTVTDVAEGRPNLVARVSGTESGPHLLLCGHTDTVAPNVGADPSSLEVRVVDGVLHGRGAVDMKGAVAAMAGALARLKPTLRRGAVSLAAVVDEEFQSLGTEALIRSGCRADAAIVGEPTSGEIALGHKGLEWLNVDFEGRAAHGGTARAGINAICAAARFIQLVETDLVPALDERRDPILGLPAVNMGTITGGDQPSTVAASCRIQLDRRWVTTETVEQVFDDLDAILRRVREAYPGLRTAVSRMPSGMATMIHGPVTVDPDHPVVTAATRALRDAGRTPVLTVFPAWSDASLLAREAGIPTIVWGPGELRYAHTPQERISLAEIALATTLYATTALHFTGGS